MTPIHEGKIGGDVAKGEGEMRAGFGLRNVTGYCDNTTVDVAYTSRKTLKLEVCVQYMCVQYMCVRIRMRMRIS